MRTPAIFLVMITLAASCRRSEPPQPATLLVTPEVAGTGLPEQLVSAFQRQTARPVLIRIVTAQQMAKDKSGSAALFTDPDLVRSFRLRAVVAFNDYYLLGPARDPVNAHSAATAFEAFARIASKNGTFCTAADVPRIQLAEREIWSAARVNVKSLRRYRRCRGDAREALTAAARMGAYTLSDRATVESVATKRLRVLLRDKALLHESYVVALLPSDRRTPNRDAEWFVQWLMSYRGREALLEMGKKTMPSLSVPGQH